MKIAGYFCLSILFSLSVRASAERLIFLNEVATIAAKNTDFLGKGYRVESKKAEAYFKLMHWTPTLTASAAKSSWIPASGGSSTEANGYTIASNWNLFSGGKAYFQAKASESASLGSQQEVLEAKRLAEIAAANLIFKKLYLADQQKIYSGLAEIKRESLKIVEERFHRGQIPLQEVTKAKIDLSQAESRARSAELEGLANKVEIKDYLDRELALQSWPLAAQEKWKSSYEHAEEIPFIKSRELELQAVEYSYKAAKSSYSPTFDLSLSYMDGPDQNRINYGAAATLTLTLPIWSQGETNALVSSNYSSWKTLDSETSFAKKDYINRQKIADQRLSLFRQNLIEAEQNMIRVKSLYQGIQKAFSLGRISVNDLFVEQSRILEVELNFASQQYSFHSNFVDNCLLFNAKLNECFLD